MAGDQRFALTEALRDLVEMDADGVTNQRRGARPWT